MGSLCDRSPDARAFRPGWLTVFVDDIDMAMAGGAGSSKKDFRARLLVEKRMGNVLSALRYSSDGFRRCLCGGVAGWTRLLMAG